MSASKKQKVLPLAAQLTLAALLVLGGFLTRQVLVLRFGLTLPTFLFFFPGVTFGAIYCGLWVGLTATIVAAYLAGFWIFDPIGKAAIERSSDSIALAVFLVVGVFSSMIAQRVRRIQQRVAESEMALALQATRAKFDAALAGLNEAVFIVDAEGRIVDFNDAFVAFYGFTSRADCAARLADYHERLDVLSADGNPMPPAMWAVSRALRGETVTDAEYALRHKDTGEISTVSCNFGPIRDLNGAIIGAVAAARDITVQRRADAALRASETRYRIAFQTSIDALALNRMSDGLYIDVNEAFLEALGYTREEIVGHTSLELRLWTDQHDRNRMVEKVIRTSACRGFEARFTRKNGESFWGTMSASIIDIDGESCILSATRDVSDAKMAEEEIRNLAFFDPLTGLANRRLLIEQLRKSVAWSSQTHRKGALLFIDLDNFKTLNDSLGYSVGDLLLREVAKRLSNCLRVTDTVARLGGDEFVALLEELSETPEEAAAHALTVAEQILASVDTPYLLDGQECGITCSIGISVFANDHENASDLLKHADIAMSQAKTAGKSTIRFFAPALQAAVTARAAIEDGLRHGIKMNEFVLYYQPQFDRGQLTGVEALLRWNHPRLGLLSPDSFMALAEETRLIVPLGKWVIESACRQIAAWASRVETASLEVAVNISVAQLRRQDFVEEVLKALELTGANPQNLRLELTESMLVTNVEDAIAKMTILRSNGLCFSLDDFGTGYSSLAYLRRLPVSQLKIDRSFIRDILVDSSSRVIAQTIISLGRAMGLSVIAEGIETVEQLDIVEKLGCHSFQPTSRRSRVRSHVARDYGVCCPAVAACLTTIKRDLLAFVPADHSSFLHKRHIRQHPYFVH